MHRQFQQPIVTDSLPAVTACPTSASLVSVPGIGRTVVIEGHECPALQSEEEVKKKAPKRPTTSATEPKLRRKMQAIHGCPPYAAGNLLH